MSFDAGRQAAQAAALSEHALVQRRASWRRETGMPCPPVLPRCRPWPARYETSARAVGRTVGGEAALVIGARQRAQPQAELPRHPAIRSRLVPRASAAVARLGGKRDRCADAVATACMMRSSCRWPMRSRIYSAVFRDEKTFFLTKNQMRKCFLTQSRRISPDELWELAAAAARPFDRAASRVGSTARWAAARGRAAVMWLPCSVSVRRPFQTGSDAPSQPHVRRSVPTCLGCP